MKVIFRPEPSNQQNDRLHFYIASFLSIIFTVLFFNFLKVHEFVVYQLLLSFFNAIVLTNVLGLILETLQWKVLKSYKDPWFKNKSWLVYNLLSSDQIFDKHDVKLNFQGSILVYTFYMAGKDINVWLDSTVFRTKENSKTK